MNANWFANRVGSLECILFMQRLFQPRRSPMEYNMLTFPCETYRNQHVSARREPPTTCLNNGPRTFTNDTGWGWPMIAIRVISPDCPRLQTHRHEPRFLRFVLLPCVLVHCFLEYHGLGDHLIGNRRSWRLCLCSSIRMMSDVWSSGVIRWTKK
ncbi:hypothetical protein BDN71DRAFT_1052166 [Pleurotus eryngii]|uniref:Uncharacterized protein n=1 Tax=Pleurotus eryngii TaxID=5323 RepID=A0A9P5ZW83_PLEER|nr:hypothetical protein BDN71DRAFT_1052166 [Pleurotus eryngii]